MVAMDKAIAIWALTATDLVMNDLRRSSLKKWVGVLRNDVAIN